MAENEIFPWLRDEHHLISKGENSTWILHHHHKHWRRDALDGEAEYRKFVQNERRVNNKSSRNGQKSQMEVPEVDIDASALKVEQIQSKVEKLQGNEEMSENNDKTMNAQWQVQLLQDVSNHYRANKADSNYIEGRLNAKMSLASERDALNEIGTKYRHLLDNNKHPKNADDENLLNENQLHNDIESSNYNFLPEKWSTYEHRPVIDSSSWKQFGVGDVKRSSGQLQNHQKQQQPTDDQLSSKRNDLWDEIDEKLSKNEQQLVPLHRVKRDVINQWSELNEFGNSPDDGDDEYGSYKDLEKGEKKFN
jgi:hypothetical protein